MFNAYVVVLAWLLLLGGKLADIFGQRRIFLTGFAILTASSLGAGLAPSGEALFAARGAMGLGAALIAPSALSLLFGIFGSRPQELGRALAFFGAAAPAGGTAGVFLGGIITEWLDWRWTFLVMIPAGLLVLAVTSSLVPAGVRRGGRLDIVGAATVTAAMIVGVYGVVTAPEGGWGSCETSRCSAGASDCWRRTSSSKPCRRSRSYGSGSYALPTSRPGTSPWRFSVRPGFHCGSS